MTAAKGTGDGAAVFVTLRIAGQLCGLPVSAVRDILREQPVTRIPLAPAAVAGSLNLRGRIVTAIDMRRRLHLPPPPAAGAPMAVVAEHEGEFYALLVDQVREVIAPDAADLEPNPATLPASLSQFCIGVYRLPGELMLLLDLARVLAIAPAAQSVFAADEAS